MDTSMSAAADMATNVQVAVRCRPINEDEERRGLVPVICCDTEKKQVKLSYGTGMKKTTKNFTYDKVFGRFATQEDVFKSTVAPMVDEVLGGFSCTAFAYGQTGTGKTWTMEGDISDQSNPKNFGIIPRAVTSVFEKLEASGADYTVRVSFLEIYQENLEDLLDPVPVAGPGKAAAGGKKLRLLEDIKKGVQVLGLEEVSCSDPTATIGLLQKGVQNRSTAATLCNKNSSRSHSVFTMKIVVKETNAGGEEEVRAGQLNLVDLAGSECVGRSGAKNERAREAGNINQSLLTLGRVITALTEGLSHIPYRDSKLTRLLQESLGGRAKTWIIATLSPISGNVDETLSTLEYALKAKSIKNKPEVNARQTSKTLMKEYNSEIESLRSMLMATREKNGVYLAPSDYDAMQEKMAAQADRIKESEQALRLREEELEEATQARGEIQTQLDISTEVLAKTEAELTQSRTENQWLRTELREAQSQLAGTKAVIAEQTRTEEELRAQAMLLTGSLEAARTDISDLFAKVARSAADLDNRSQRARTLKSDCDGLFAAIQHHVAGLGTASSAAATALQGAIGALIEREMQEVSQTFSSLSGEVDILVKDGGEAAGRVGKEMCARLSKEIVEVLVQESREQSQAMLQRAKDYQVAADASSAEVRTAFQETSSWIEGTMKVLNEHAVQGKMAIEKLAAEHKNRAIAVQRDVGAFVATWQAQAQAESADREDFLQAQKAALQKGSQALLQSVQQQVTQLLAQCNDMQNSYEEQALQRSQEQNNTIASFQNSMSMQLEATAKSVETDCISISTATLVPVATTASANLASLAETYVPRHEMTINKVDEEAAALVSGLEEATASADKNMQATLESGAEVIKDIEAETSKVEALLKNKGLGVLNAMSAAGQASSERLTEQGMEFISLVQSSLSEPLATGVTAATEALGEVDGVVQGYTSQAGRVEEPTNTTPKKRDYPGPPSLSATRPHEEIIAQARVLFEEQGPDERSSNSNMDVESNAAEGDHVHEKRGHPEEESVGEDEGHEAPLKEDSKKPRLSADSEEGQEQQQQQPDEKKPKGGTTKAGRKTVDDNTNATSSIKTAPGTTKTRSKLTRIPRPGTKPLGDIKNAM